MTIPEVSSISLAKAFGIPESQGNKAPININNFSGLSRKWVGVKITYMLPLSWERQETQKLTSQEISVVKILFIRYLVYVFKLKKIHLRGNMKLIRWAPVGRTSGR